jgi:C1A family cysteine protease
MSEKGLGRRHAPDERDRQFHMRSIVAQVPATSRFYRTGPVLDQGNTSSCVGHAWRQFLSSAPIMSKGGPSAFAIYHEAQQVDEWEGEGYDGTSVRAGARVLTTLRHLQSYVWAWDAATVRDFVLAKSSVVFGTNWYRSMYEPDNAGVVCPGGQIAGGHAYLCIGYSQPRGAFRFINSWGRTWADGGRFWMLGEHVDLLLRDEGEACAAVEQKL